MKIQQRTKVELVGRGKVTITSDDYLATGGQASVYRKHDTAIKLYTDPADIKRDGLVQRVQRLSVLDHPSICAPANLVRDVRTGEVIGFYAPFAVGDGLTTAFTNTFWTEQNFSAQLAAKVVERQREILLLTHQHHVYQVDANQENWVLELKKGNPIPKVFDVDSWVPDDMVPDVVPKMPSISDWFNPNVSIESDYFAFAVITFQLFTGIHPYRGGLDGYKNTELERRMKDRASVFTKEVRLNSRVRRFEDIAAKLLEWYEATFEGEERSEPPSPLDTATPTPRAAKVKRVVVTKAKTLVYEKLLEGSNDSAIKVFPCGVVMRRNGSLYDLYSKQEIGVAANRQCEVVKHGSGWLLAQMVDDKPTFHFIDEKKRVAVQIPFALMGSRIVRNEDRLYLVTGKGMTPINMRSFTGGKTVISTGTTLGALVNSTKWFDNVAIQDEFGATFVIVTFGTGSGRQVRVKELDGLKPILAKAGPRFVALLCADKSGEYQQIELTFSKDYSSYQLWSVATDTPDLNMSILPKGVAASVKRDGELCIYVPSSGQVVKVEDSYIATDMILYHWDNTVVYIQDGNVWSVRMKS